MIERMGMLAQAAQTTQVDEQIELLRWSSGNALIAGIVIAAGLLYLARWQYRHEGRGSLSAGRRRLLMGVRWLVLLMLGLMGLEPVVARYLHRRLAATTLVLVDESASMGIRDRLFSEVGTAGGSTSEPAEAEGAEGPSRAEVVERVADAAWFKRLLRRNSVRVFGFGETLRELGVPGVAETQPSPTTSAATGLSRGAGRLHVDPRDGVTNLSHALREAIDAVGGSPVAGVVLISDGGFNEGEPVEAVGRFLKARSVPVWSVGVGDPHEPVNVRVADVISPRVVFKGDPFQVVVELAGEGLGGRSVELTLRRRRGASAASTVNRRQAAPRRDGRFDPVQFECRERESGDVTFEAIVTPIEGEVVESDNARETQPAVRVLEDKMRVLLVGGSPSYDYRYVARALIRDRTIDVGCWLQSADARAVREGTTILNHLPVEADELFGYDAILLLDPDGHALPPGWVKRVATLVTEYGGGLLYAAGRKFTGDFLRNPKTAPLVEVLPVVPDRDAELVLNDLGIYQRKGWPIRISDDALSNPLLRMSDDPLTTRSVWSRLGGVYWHYPVRREKPAATVLMRHSNPRMTNAAGSHVLLATQIVGSGRTAFLGFDGTWRWRRTGEAYFNRFWIQMLRFLMEGKLGGGRNRVTILTDRDRYQVGETVVVTARALDANYAPVRRPSVDLHVQTPDRVAAVATLEGVENRPGYFQGRVRAGRAGTLRLSVELPGRPGEVLRAERDVAVAQPDLELGRPVMRRDWLQSLARQTGGRYFDVQDAERVPETIGDCAQTMIVRERPKSLWDNAYVLYGLIVLLGLEWALRRAANLI